MGLVVKFSVVTPEGDPRQVAVARLKDGKAVIEEDGGKFQDILDVRATSDGETYHKPEDGEAYLRDLPATFRTAALYAEIDDEPEGEPEEFDPEELSMGEKVELEHTDDPAEARKIAQDHLREHPDYYSRLKKTGLAEELKPEVTKAVEDLREFYRARGESVYGEVVRAAQTAGYSQVVAKSMGEEARARVKNEYVEALNAAIESGRARLAQIRNGR